MLLSQAGPSCSQEHLFKVVGRPIVENVLDGFNSTVFAFGQTGSGKTYTMLGAIPAIRDDFPLEAGLIPRIFSHLFGRIRELEAPVGCGLTFLQVALAYPYMTHRPHGHQQAGKYLTYLC